MISIAILLFIFVTLYLRLREGFYNPSKDDQRVYEMEDHKYDGNLFEAEIILYDMINNVTDNNLKQHLSELLNLLQFI